jgi:hypothetical protein
MLRSGSSVLSVFSFVLGGAGGLSTAEWGYKSPRACKLAVRQKSMFKNGHRMTNDAHDHFAC